MKQLVFAILFLVGLTLKAQDPSSSQFYFNQLNMNPAFAGLNKGARMGATYRNQWVAIPGKFVNYNAWGDIYNPFFNGGVGFIASQDVEGEGLLKTTSIGIIQSYETMIPKIIKIRAGYNVTVMNKKIDWDKLVFSDQLDGIQGQIYPSSVSSGSGDGKTFADFSAGTIFDFPVIKRFHNILITSTIGYSVNHLTEPNDALSGAGYTRLLRKQTYHGGFTFEFLDDIKDKKPYYLSPNIIYERQGKFTTTNIGFYALRRPMLAGIFYRKKTYPTFKDQDSFILFVGFSQNTNKTTIFRVGYSYDFTINRLASNTMGSHEISISIEFKNKRLFSKNARLRRRNKRAVECTDFGERSFLF